MAPPRPATPTKRAAAAASIPAFSPSAGQVGGKRVSLGGDGPGAGAALCCAAWPDKVGLQRNIPPRTLEYSEGQHLLRYDSPPALRHEHGSSNSSFLLQGQELWLLRQFMASTLLARSPARRRQLAARTGRRRRRCRLRAGWSPSWRLRRPRAPRHRRRTRR